MRHSILRIERAFAAYFRRCASGDTPGYPRFQGAGRYRTFTYPQFGNGAYLEREGVTLSKIGPIAVCWSCPLEGTPKTVTLSRESDGWYICFSCADVPLRPLPPTGSETGIDLGLKVFLVCADGSRVENPRYHRCAEKALKKAHRRVSRRKLGSSRRRKAVRWLAQRYAKVRRQRDDFRHKTALALLHTYDTGTTSSSASPTWRAIRCAPKRSTTPLGDASASRSHARQNGPASGR